MDDRRLFVLRHAKSSWKHSGLSDHERPLSGRGHDALPRLRRALEERAPAIEVVLCSSAVRTVATLEGVRAALPERVQVTVDAELYGAGGQSWLERCRSVGDDVAGVLVIGHNPGIGMLANMLVRIPPKHHRFSDYPTCTTTVIDFDGESWMQAKARTGYCKAFVVPRDLIGTSAQDIE